MKAITNLLEQDKLRRIDKPLKSVIQSAYFFELASLFFF